MVALRKFVQAVVLLFSDEHLRAPTVEDTARLLAIGEQRGFPGMLGNIDCMHWVWKNCPKHAFFGMSGSLNDINVLHRSNIFSRLTDGIAPPVSYIVNSNTYDMGYYLGDGIYPEWVTIVKPISAPRENKSVHFSAMQAAVRKDVERTFGVLQSRFTIIRGPTRVWDQSTLHNIMITCVIMHNMIIEDERGGADVEEVYDYMGEKAIVHHDPDQPILQYVEVTEAIRNQALHHQLRDDLVEHLWSRHGAQ
ncbi:uncharacterized protein LOC133907222 [Phragmites australis]|uniref:uncharacterized protein LOC133907222 n=1 Tax=Phragmites australis TaxID=29695 RepID=UPI002D76593C|nr:uncharacterized protein LOC133907222 [Phragmites australis]